MATKTKKPPQPPAESVPPPTDEQIVERLGKEAAMSRARLDKAKREFVERFADNPTDTLDWVAGPVAELEAGAKAWRMVDDILAWEDRSLAQRLAAIVAEVRSEQDRILDLRPWESLSSSAYTNAGKLHATTGATKALRMILIYIGVAIKQVEGRDKGEG